MSPPSSPSSSPAARPPLPQAQTSGDEEAPSGGLRERLDLQRIATLARPELRRLILGTVALTISAGMSLAYPWFVKRIVDGVLAGQGRGALDGVVLALLGMFAVGSVMGALRAWWFTVAGERIVSDLRKNLYAAITAQEIAFFDERRTGELTNRLASDATVLQNTVTVNVSMALRYAVMCVGAITIMVFTSWRLTLVMLSVVPLVVVGARVYGRVLRKISRAFQDTLARATTVAEETIGGIRTVRAFAREQTERERYNQAVEDSFDLARRRAKVASIFRGAAGFFSYAAIAAVLWYGGLLLSEGQLTMGELTSFLLYTFTVAFSLGALSGLWEDFMKAVGSSERVFELLDRQSTVAGGTDRIDELSGRVELVGVHFAYPSRSEHVVLNKVDLVFEPSSVTALVGPSGAGKSTIAALISRFYDPQQGTISLDGRSLRELDGDWLRGQVGVVRQEPVLFASSILDNIRYGRQTASQDQAMAAAEAANAHDFISSFPEGYGTLVGERGIRLSGGQKQRVAIARALLKDPRVLVLDEATSALDAESEHQVQEALQRLMKGRTTVVIAHRLSTVKAADHIVVMDAGEVVQVGSHAELLERGGLYRRLVERQFAA